MLAKSKPWWILFLAVILALLVCALPPEGRFRTVLSAVFERFKGEKTTSDRLAEFGPAAHDRMAAYFQTAAIAYPPGKVTLVGLKDEKILEVWVSVGQKGFQFLRTYPILGASGVAGPKLAEGDGAGAGRLLQSGVSEPEQCLSSGAPLELPQCL